MTLNNFYNLESLNSFLRIPKEEYDAFKKDIIEINLNTGDYLYTFEEIPSGVVLINQGSMRLVGKDDNNEIFSINKYGKNAITTEFTILNNIRGTALIVSSDLRGFLIKTEIFLKAYSKYEKFRNLFIYISKEEYFFLSYGNKDPRLMNTKKLLKWSELESNKKNKSFLINKSNQKVPDKNENWIVSCKNITDYKFGDIITAGKPIKVKGDLPARLIPLPSIWPPIENENITNSKEGALKKVKNNKSLVESYLKDYKSEEIKSLENIYGRLDSDTSFPSEKGYGLIEESLACLRMISLYFELPFKRDLIKKILKDQTKRLKEDKISLFNIAAISDLLGLKTYIINPKKLDKFNRIPTPTIFLLNNSPKVCWKIKDNKFFISDPKEGRKIISFNDLIKKYEIENLNFLILEKTKFTPQSRFGLGWFLPSIKKHKNSLIQVVIASFFVQLLALFNPLLIQQIIDAVINQGSLRSLNVLGFLLIAMAVAQALLTSLRTFLFTDTTNRIDASLGSSIVNHLFRLPLQYFSKRSIGEVSSRVGELEKIRNFLTGTALTILLDAIFSLIYIAIMLAYSVKLTIWALSVIPFFMILTIVISPIIKNQLREQAEASARVNSHLVETISGIETVKAQGMEMLSEWKWGKLYSRQIKSGFKNTITSTTASSISNFFQQLSGLIIIWVGAGMVLRGQLSLGQLIAFRIISGYVTNPILRLSSFWQNFQEISVSLNRLSDVVDNKEEIEINGDNLAPLPPINGKVIYENINFSFNNDNKLQLKNISFEIDSGNFVGIVGESGSGKSTILKVLMRFYNQTQGKIKIDNFDVSKVDLYSLRNQIGIVQQESLLFDGTIFSNISIARPNASFEEVVKASKQALAHDFIEDLPSGYSNTVNEKGTELSGGQRQRIAIARMILSDPNLVILDEATSALDVETEKQVLNNILRKFDKKTIFFISHRIHNIVNADKILVMKNGTLVEQGTHNELIKANNIYANLYKKQDLII